MLGDRSHLARYPKDLIKFVAENVVDYRLAHDIYGISRAHFYRIKNGEARQRDVVSACNTKGRVRVYQDECVMAIRSGVRVEDAKRLYGISKSQFYRIKNNEQRVS